MCWLTLTKYDTMLRCFDHKLMFSKAALMNSPSSLRTSFSLVMLSETSSVKENDPMKIEWT